jgi:hypothetical protein
MAWIWPSGSAQLHTSSQVGGITRVLIRVSVRALGKLAKRLSTRSVRLARMILIQAIRNAMVNDLVVRDVADLAAVPAGKRDGRLGRSTWSRLLPCWTQLSMSSGNGGD